MKLNKKERYNQNFEIRLATIQDITAIQDLLFPEYFNETIFKGLTYSPEGTLSMIVNMLTSCHVLIAEVNGEIAGVCAVRFARTYFKELEADINLFIIKKDFRGSPLVKGLIISALEAIEQMEAKVVYSSCNSGLDLANNVLWENLWKKFDFKVLGSVMIRI